MTALRASAAAGQLRLRRPPAARIGHHDAVARSIEAVQGVDAYARGIVASVRNNASAYGFSVVITAAFGLLSSSRSSYGGFAVLLFGLGAAAAFVTVTAGVWRFFRRERGETEKVVLLDAISGVLAIAGSIAVAFGTSRFGALGAWPLTGYLTTLTYLAIEGADIFVAARLARGNEPGD
jgi:hypothetical protein